MSVIENLGIMFSNAFGLGYGEQNEVEQNTYDTESSIEDSESNIIYFDFETTGLNPFHDKVIELCFLYDSPKQKDAPSTAEAEVFRDDQIFTSLVNPKRKFEEKITNITGIHPYDLINKPSIEELHPVLINFLDNNMFNYLIAHNCHGFDEIILKKILKEANGSYLLENICFIDTLLLARKLMPELNRFSQKSLCDYFKIKTKSHRADEDCKALQSIYHNLLKIYRKRVNSSYSVDFLIGNPHIIHDYLYN
jgi:DNA polymerase III alpha subunit (gram-positive type)